MTRCILTLAIALALASSFGACKSGGGGPLIDPNSGRIDASIAVEGPFDPTVQLETGLFLAGTDFMTDQAVAGKVTSTLTSFISGRTVRALGSQLFTGTYELQVWSGTGAAKHTWFDSPPIQPGFNGATTTFNNSFSFTGPAPFGSVSGSIALTGEWPVGRNVFMGFTRTGGDGALLQWPVAEAGVVDGSLPYTVSGLSFGSYEVALYSADQTGGDIRSHGTLGASLDISAAQPSPDGQDFAADFTPPL